jgi:DNA repair exonuclease SbcCD nuclease subunit
MLAKKKEQQDEWAAKMRRSPFKIDLVAENERLEEELRIRIKQEERRQKQFERQEQKLKNEVFVQALQQATDLDVLRAEKRMILLEEKRLQALMGVEKSKSTRKNDMMAAMRAEKQRRAQKLEFRRQQRMLAESRYQEAHAQALLEKLGLDGGLKSSDAH